MLISWVVVFVIIYFSRCLCDFVEKMDKETSPMIKLLPQYSWYLIGESVTLKCLAPEESMKQYTFYKDYMPISTQNSLSFHIPQLKYSHSGLYKCETVQHNVISTSSNKQAIHVYALPPPPIISLKPAQDIYLVGDHIAMTCSTFKVHETILRLYRNKQKILELFSEKGTLFIDTSLPGVDGEYGCDYQTKRYGRWIDSPTSTVSVTISGQATEGKTVSTSSLLTSTNSEATTRTTETPISTDQTTKDRTTSTSFLTYEIKSNSEVTTKTMKSPISTGTAINEASMLSASTSKDQDIDIETTSSTSPPTRGLATWIYCLIGSCLFFILICILLSSYFSRKGNKTNPANTPLWMNANISDPNQSYTYKETEMEMTEQTIKDLHTYTEIDECPPLMKMPSAPRPPSSSGPLVHIKRLDLPLYSYAQAISPLPYAYSTPLSQKPEHASCPNF